MKKEFRNSVVKFAFCAAIILSAFKTQSQTWNPAGTGIDNNVYGFTTDVSANVIYAFGHFFNCGATPVNHIAKWDGSTWSGLGTGTDQDIYSATMFNGELYIAGKFLSANGINCNRVARWDGTTFQPLGAGMNGEVFYLHVYNGALYAGGNFTTADGVAAAGIAKWDGTGWSSLSGGIAGGIVYSIQNYGGELYATGNFSNAGGVAVNNIAKWDGTSWSDVGGGLSGFNHEGYDLTVYKNELYVTGFFQTAGNDTVNGLAKWNGTSWSGFGSGLTGAGGYGVVFSTYHGELYVGGNFASINNFSANMVARYNGISWNNLGAGCDQEVDGLEVYNNDLFVGGAFYDAGGLGISKVAIWNSGCTAATIASGKNVSCFGACDGTVSVYAAGNEPFNFLWSNGGTTAALTALCPGVYSVTLTDSSGCAATDSVEIIEYPLPVSSVTGNAPTCFGQCSGSAVVAASGFAPFNYSWSTFPVQTTDTAIALCSGIYYVTIIDSAGCSVVDSISISDPAAATLNFSSVSPLCPGSCNGVATVNTSSMYPPFNYLWSTSPVQTNQTSVALCSGSYVVTVTDSLGCSTVDSVSITDPVLNLSMSSTNVSCSGSGCDGTALAIATGPVPFTYLWSTTDTTNALSNLCQGTYVVIATDSNNCVLTDSVFISQPIQPTVNLNYTAPLCYNVCNGIVNALPSGSGTFNYLWANGSTTSSITNACFGWNAVTVTDTLGCSVTDSIIVFQPDTLLITTSNTVNVSCNGSCDGFIGVNVNGGTPAYSYLWSNGSPTPNLLNVCAGTYTATVTDAHGCTSQLTHVVTEPDSLIVTLTSSDATCMGCNDGTLTTSVTGGTPPYNYFFTPVGVDTLHVTAGHYYLCVTDAHACLSCDSTIVNEPNGVFEFAANFKQLKVYPNPFNSSAVIVLPITVSSVDRLDVHFYDVFGKENKSFAFGIKQLNQTVLVIDRKMAATGMYFFKAETQNGVIGAGRFIVE